MILSAKKILELNERYHLIENLAERELTDPEGVGIDIRVGEVFKLNGEGFLGVEDRSSPDAESIASIEKGDKEIVIKSGEYFLVKTIEKITAPSGKVEVEVGRENYLMPHVYPRSTLQRCGLFLKTTKTDPGYSGELTFALVNLSNSDFRLELGARIANVIFHEVVGELHRAYEGQWNDGRVSTGGKEKQI
jgi:deoxycytidine triphosphate deaminase